MSEATARAAEFLTFALGSEEYGVDILKVKEIRGYDAVTRLPDAPDYIKGVINLRGTIVPVVDMRLKFRLERAEYTALTVMIVLNVADRVVGMVVDSVSDVVQLSAEQVRAVPEIGATIVINTDAHRVSTMDNMRYGVATARRAWLTRYSDTSPPGIRLTVMAMRPSRRRGAICAAPTR